MTTTSPVLEARHVRRKADGGTILLDDVSLRIEAGTATAITGPPGSGKTLLLRALALLDPLAAGELRFRGQPIVDRDVPAVRRKVLLLQQRPVLVEGTVRDNLRLPFAYGHDAMPPDEAWAAGQLAQLGRDAAFLSRSAGDLSGGESQIVALLRALQLHPCVLLLDEPTSSLDAQSTQAIERLVTDWRDAGDARALVVVTHQPEQARRMAQRILSMQDGRMIPPGGNSQ